MINMKNITKILLLILVILVIGLSGCGGNIATDDFTIIEIGTEAILEQTSKFDNVTKKEEFEDVKQENVITSEKNTPIPTPSDVVSKKTTEQTMENPTSSGGNVDTPHIEEKKEQAFNDHALRCTLSIKCDEAVKNSSLLNEEKKNVIPIDGVIYEEAVVEFYEGETVFNVLLRELKKKKVHIEFESTPMYNSVYIKGISNLYEFDCGRNSGWLYMVNGETPGVGSSQYYVKNNDKIH